MCEQRERHLTITFHACGSCEYCSDVRRETLLALFFTSFSTEQSVSYTYSTVELDLVL